MDASLELDSLFLGPFVEGRGDDAGLGLLAPDLDLELRPDGRAADRQIDEADGLLEKRRERPRGDFGHLLALVVDGIVRPGDARLDQLEADELARQAFGQLLDDDRLAEEIALLELDDQLEVGLE